MYTYAVSSLDDGGGEEKKRKEGGKKKKCIYKYRKKHGNAPCHHRCSAQISFAPRSRQLDCYNSEIKIARWSLDRERSGLKATWYPLSLSLSPTIFGKNVERKVGQRVVFRGLDLGGPDTSPVSMNHPPVPMEFKNLSRTRPPFLVAR